MAKFLKLLLASSLVFALTACSSSDNSDDTASDTNECPVRIGLVTDTGGVDDKSFNQSSWEGLLRYAEENNFSTEKGECIDYLQSGSDADYIPNLSTFADEEYDLIIAVGYLFQEAIDTVAPLYPESNFLFIDSVSDNPNVMSAVYNAQEGCFLVGVAAGLEAKANGSNAVGFMGGMEGELIGAFQAGYEQGVLAVNPEATIYVDYADSFSDDAKGQVLGAKQFDLGATIVYAAAGNAGNGVIKEAKERGDVWAIGTDKDQYADGTLDDGSSIILTSFIKRVDTATYTAATNVLNGAFQGGVYTFDTVNEGVGAELTADRNLSAETIAILEDYSAKIASGEIVVDPIPTIANGASNK